MEEITLTIRDGKPTATSLQIAESFEKEHRDVVRAIRNLVSDLRATNGGEEFNVRNFAHIIYTDSRGRTQSAYALTRDGFTLLTMGFTGEKALQFKMAYIDAFNRMEAELLKQSTALALPGKLPALYCPEFDLKKMGSQEFRYAVTVVDALRKIDAEIKAGNAYMLPDGCGKVTIPGKKFYGWYSDSVLTIPDDVAYPLGLVPISRTTRWIEDEGAQRGYPTNWRFVQINLLKF